MKDTLDYLKKYTGINYSEEEALALTTLDLWDNQITDLKPLEKLINLTTLYLGDNQITDLKPLEKLTNLTWLNLWDNQITDLKPLEKLTNLTTLGLWGNQITDLKPLEKLTNLTWLDLGRNYHYVFRKESFNILTMVKSKIFLEKNSLVKLDTFKHILKTKYTTNKTLFLLLQMEIFKHLEEGKHYVKIKNL
jgi:Leucine-rich repeat (LRR) protein